jgi:hypothetical protein
VSGRIRGWHARTKGETSEPVKARTSRHAASGSHRRSCVSGGATDRQYGQKPGSAPWGAVIDLPTAGRIFGLGRSLTYDLARTGDFPCRVIRIGSRYRVPVAGILAALGILTRDADLTRRAESSVDHPGEIRSSTHRGEP